MKRVIVLVMLCAVGLSSCGGAPGGNPQNIVWQLETINYAPGTSGQTVTLLLANNSFSSRVAGTSLYPDYVRGTYTLNGSSLAFSILDGMTVLSTDTAHAAIYLEYKGTLAQTASFSVAIDRLTLYDTLGRPILTFVSKGPPTPTLPSIQKPTP